MFSALARRFGAVLGLSAVCLTAAPPDALARVARPATDSLEYHRSWGLEAIRAQSAYAAGLSGRGVSIALVDCGLVKPQRDVMRNVSRRRSVDLIAQRTSAAVDRHGSEVAGPLGSALNGRGIVGVAYNATLLAIRADFDGGLPGGECAFHPIDLARALDYAADQQARVVVLPVQATKPLGPAFETALARLVQGGAVIVIAAGNDGNDQPAWPARYAVDPRYAGSILVAGALGWNGERTAWTNRAGEAKPYYLMAPGQWIITDCGRRCALASGTSFSTPYLAGAVALMIEAHPELTGPEAALRILEAGRDVGAAGVDEVYGRGVLDLSRAFPAVDAQR